MRLLIAEDDVRLLKSLKHIFEKENYIVDSVSNGSEAYEYASSETYDGIILDIMMPDLDGIEVLKRLRKKGISTPVLFLTAKTEIDQRVEGLDAGADDYLPKPFSSRELLARVRAMLRRKDSFLPDIIRLGETSLNRSTCELHYQDTVLHLNGKEYQIIDMFFQTPRNVITMDHIISRVWGFNSDVEIQTVWVHISNLRKKLSSHHIPLEIRHIKNVGYILSEVKHDL